jgi:hypothetical protein
MLEASLVGVALLGGLAVAAGVQARQQGSTAARGGEVPGQAGKEGTGATGGVPGAASTATASSTSGSDLSGRQTL